MHTAKWPRPLIAGLLVLAMVVSLTGLLGAAGTSIRIASPKAGARVSGIISVQASVKTDEQVSYVILGIDDNRPQSSNSAPFSFDLDTRELTDGPHRLFVEAYDRYGLVGSSSVVTIYVKNSSSMVQAKKEPAVKVAAKPAPQKKTAVARAPRKVATVAKAEASPAARSAASAPGSAARTASAPEVRADPEAVSPMMLSGRGPVPAPTRSASETAIAAAKPGAEGVSGGRGVADGPLGSAPPMPRIASAVPASGTARTHMVVLNGRAVEFDVAPKIVDGRMRVAFRSMFESQGARVGWNATTRTATGVKGALTVEVPVGGHLARVNGRQVDMGCAATIEQGRTIIPIRFFGTVTGADVYWNSQTRTAMLVTTQKAIAELPQ